MKPSSANPPSPTNPPPARSGRRALALALFCFLLGAALAGFWLKHGKPMSGGAELSASIVDQLRHLNSPVEIRFYSVLPSGGVPAALQDFSGRVDRLLSEFEAANESQIHVVRNISISGANADTASADGIQPFNLEKGEACFLGIAAVSGGRKESLARIQPEWEPALPFDLARVILQVTATPSSPVVKAVVPVSPETTNEILRLIPDVNGTSLDDGIGILREAAVNKIIETGAAMDKQIQAAQQQLADAQNGGSAAEQQAATKQLQQVTLKKAEKLKAITAQLEVQIFTFEQMKAAPAAK